MVRLRRADDIVRRSVYATVGAGLLPLPLLDLVVITGIQLAMLRALSRRYGVPFRRGAAKQAIAALLVGLGGISIGGVVGASLTKLVPGLGTPLGMASVPVVAGGLTHAVGRTFTMHFESGGTLLDWDPAAMRAHFEREFAAAKDAVTTRKAARTGDAPGEPR